MGKVHAARIHSTRRAYERFGIHISKARRREMVKDIKAARAKFVERQSLSITVWEFEVDGEKMHTVYNKELGEIVTVLPANRDRLDEVSQMLRELREF